MLARLYGPTLANNAKVENSWNSFFVFLEPSHRETCCANAIGFIETKKGGWSFCRSAEVSLHTTFGNSDVTSALLALCRNLPYSLHSSPLKK